LRLACRRVRLSLVLLLHKAENKHAPLRIIPHPTGTPPSKIRDLFPGITRERGHALTSWLRLEFAALCWRAFMHKLLQLHAS
jgi:hypothetical protein